MSLRRRLLDRLEHEPPPPAPAATALPVAASPPAAAPREPKAPRVHLYCAGTWWPAHRRGVCGAQRGRFEEVSPILGEVDCPRCLQWFRARTRRILAWHGRSIG